MSDIAIETGLLDRAWRRVTTLWRDMADRVVGAEESETIADQMRACLAGRGGEVSARNRAARLAQAYIAATPEGRAHFLRSLASFDSDTQAVRKAAEDLAAADTQEEAAAKSRLRRALEPPRVKLLTQFTTIPDGMKFLVDLRAELMRLAAEDPALVPLEADLKGLLAAFFDVGFLELKRIDWTSPAALLEKLVQYEAVHRIRGWRDLKNRLESDRRCYAFFHPRMPDEPLIFVEVALCRGLAENVQRLLDEKAPILDPAKADTAIFYSINNCQRGLDGISFGNFLIKRVVALLQTEQRNIRHFATLSPIPGFSRWLTAQLADGDPALVTEDEAEALRTLAPANPALPAPGDEATTVTEESPVQTLARLLARRGWWREEALAKALEPVVLRACARYLLNESARGNGKRARDPVAHFHLSNGARVERLNWKGDTSEKGLKESHGLMVNYLYDPARIEEHHEEYVGEGKRPAASAMRKLVRGG